MAGTDLDVLARHVELADRDVADVGCGQGLFTAALDRREARATGIEVTEAKVSAARRSNDGSGAAYALGSGEALPLDDATQDVVVYLRSLHHVPVEAMGDALREARRVLRDNGILYVVEPLPEGDFYAMVRLVEDETEVRAAAARALRDAGAAGLHPVATERYETSAGCFGDLDDVRERIVGVDPARAPVFEARRAELQRLFDTGGVRVADFATEFSSAQRLDVLRAS